MALLVFVEFSTGCEGGILLGLGLGYLELLCGLRPTKARSVFSQGFSCTLFSGKNKEWPIAKT